MKSITFSFLLLTSNLFLSAQNTRTTKFENDTLFTISGYKVTNGQDLDIGVGSTPDGDFKFIRRNSTGFGTFMETTDDNAYNKSQFALPRKMAGHKGKVVKIATRGNEKIGLKYEPLITFGSGRYEVDIDNAILAGEIVVPDEFKPKPTTTVIEIKQPASVADELIKLKKLLTDSVITKEEFEVQKKKVLGN